MKSIARIFAVIHAVSGLILLLFSGWFIAACAIAGVDYASVNFNYLLPAVIIRGLALTRIASGYAQMWTGHRALLSHVKWLRLDVFQRLKNRLIRRRSEGTEALAKHSETIASLNMAWTAHTLGALFIIAVVSVALWLWLPKMLWIWFCMVCASSLLVVFAMLTLQKKSREILRLNTSFRQESEHHLDSASLWHLREQLKHSDRMAGFSAVQAEHGIGERMLWWTQVIAYMALIVLLSLGYYHGQAVLLIGVLLLLAAKDWLGQFWRAQRAYAEYRESQHSFDSLATQELPSSTIQPGVVKSLELKKFTAQGRAVAPISLTCEGSDIVLLKGGSGAGKSSILMALSGLLPHKGEKLVNGEAIPAGFIAGWYYAEQMPQVLSASVAANLRLANPDADDAQIRKALDAAGLQSLDTLSEWIGEQGRRLSGGELKRLNIARALLFDAQLYLFDEPFEGLDDAMQQHVAKVINELSQRAPVIVASHIVPDSLQIKQTMSLL